MRKIILFALLMTAGFAASAQTKLSVDSLQHYVGKYKFGPESPVGETNVVVKDGVLYASSDAGETQLAKTEVPDVFSVVTYSGLATFKRNGEGKVIAVKIEIGDMVFEGTKQD